MVTISLCMIVKNEEKLLGRCLESVKDIVDEIIIVDTGSNDNTKTIANKFTNLVYDFKWVDDFSKARNYSFSKASKDYILWLDADDILLEEDRLKLLNLKNTLTNNIDIVMMKYNVGFDEDGNVNFSYYRERLLKRAKSFTWVSPIHEVIVPFGNIYYSDICITHKSIHSNHTKRNLKIFEKIMTYSTLDARQSYYYARELMYDNQYFKAIDKFNEFLNMKNAWIENKLNAYLDLSACYKELGDSKNELLSLLTSFSLGIPRAEILSSIGIYFMKNSNYETAIYWFKQALKCKINLENGSFCIIDYYRFIPYINIGFCYYKLGNYHLSRLYNEKAGKIKKHNKTYLYNKSILDSI